MKWRRERPLSGEMEFAGIRSDHKKGDRKEMVDREKKTVREDERE